MKKTKKWSRRNELLVVLPWPRPLDGAPSGGARWTTLLKELARDWRIFLAYEPREGGRLRVGGAGLDPVTMDSGPSIRRALAEELISGVILVGQAIVSAHLEPLHAYSPHIPFLAALEETAGIPEDKLEFLLGWSDRILFADEGCRKRAESRMRRLEIPSDVVPSPARPGLFGPFVRRLSQNIQQSFLELNDRSGGERPELIACLDKASRRRWPAAFQEWRAGMDGDGGFFILPDSDRPAWQRPIRRHWPRAVLLPYRGEGQALARVNEALMRSGRRRALMLTPWARMGSKCVESMLVIARAHPLTALVCGADVSRPGGENRAAWEKFTQAWFLKHHGGYHLTTKFQAGCFLADREAVRQAGFLDPRLGWDYAVRDLGLRVRQNGWNIFTAEDAPVAQMPRIAEAAPGRGGFRDSFVRKWALDPTVALDGAAGPSRP